MPVHRIGLLFPDHLAPPGIGVAVSASPFFPVWAPVMDWMVTPVEREGNYFFF
jgi:hypothetical protein